MFLPLKRCFHKISVISFVVVSLISNKPQQLGITADPHSNASLLVARLLLMVIQSKMVMGRLCLGPIVPLAHRHLLLHHTVGITEVQQLHHIPVRQDLL